MILDTTFIIDLMMNDNKAREKLHELKKESMFITSITVFELFSGVVRSNNPNKEKNKVLDALSDQLVLPLTDKSAENAGVIDGLLIKEEKMISPTDCMIAGIATLKNQPVLTRNIKDFSKIKDLKVETY